MYFIAFVLALTGLFISLILIIHTGRRTEILPRPTFGAATPIFAALLPITFHGKEQLSKDLIRGGYLHETATNNYLATRNSAFLTWAVFWAAMLALELVEPNRIWLWIGIGGAIAILALPRLLISTTSSKRALRISHDLPDALDLLAMTMSGGMTMQESLNHVIWEFDQTHPALAGEMQIIARQANTGTLDGALVAFAERLDLPEVTALTAMLRGGHQAGGSLVEALRTFSDGLRNSRDQNAKERGNKAAVKLLLPVVFCLAPPIYILLLGPAFMDLKDFVEKENQPGGALAPVIEQSQARPTSITRSARIGADAANR